MVNRDIRMDIQVVIDMHLHNVIIDDFSKYVRSPSCVSKCFRMPDDKNNNNNSNMNGNDCSNIYNSLKQL